MSSNTSIITYEEGTPELYWGIAKRALAGLFKEHREEILEHGYLQTLSAHIRSIATDPEGPRAWGPSRAEFESIIKDDILAFMEQARVERLADDVRPLYIVDYNSSDDDNDDDDNDDECDYDGDHALALELDRSLNGCEYPGEELPSQTPDEWVYFTEEQILADQELLQSTTPAYITEEQILADQEFLRSTTPAFVGGEDLIRF